ncbi:MAG: Lrp/AsnC family transcriptional regulator [Robiginitomaculum sp.]|nr:Lrp/AsnC family transcriptional regulator [Robiginitomaculum sp.]
MDAIDRKIIRALQQDARLTNQDLAARVGLSPSPCLRRVRKLEQDGIFAGYTALVDQEKFGLPINVFVNIRLEKPSTETIRAFEKAIESIDAVVECYLMTGNRDYLLRVVSSDLKSYEHLVRDRLTTIPGVLSLESSFAFGQVKRTNILPFTP